MKKILLSMLGVLLALPGFARDFTYEYEGQKLTYTVLDEDAKTCQPMNGFSNMHGEHAGNTVYGALSIPSVAKDGDIEYSVTRIGIMAFSNCSRLTSVTIPNSVTSIGVYAFSDCSSLTSVFIPTSVTSIGERAFSGCYGLQKAAYPSGLSNPFSNGTTIQYPREEAIIEDGIVFGPEKKTIYFAPHTFEGEYVIPASVTSIGASAFRACSSLTSVIIPSSVTAIGDNAFLDCSGLKKSAYPSGLSNPFSNGTTIQYPREGAIIEDGFIYGPEKKAIYFAPLSLKEEYVIPSSVTKIGGAAYSHCSGLTSVTIPNSVTEISKGAFYKCTGLTSVIIPNSVTSIGEKAFSGCSGLTSAIIGNSVASIGNYAFSGCSGLKKSAYPSGLSDPFSSGTVIQYPREGAIIEDGIVFGPEKNAIYFARLSLEGEYVIPESVTSIGGEAFYGCSALTSVKATAINPPVMNDNSFEGLYATAALSVPVEATTDYLATNWTLFNDFRIGDSEAAGQTYETGNLKYMLIPGKAQEDKNLAVVIPGDYSSLTEVTIPERFSVPNNGVNDRYYVDGIGFKAFNGCSGLATVTFNSRNASKAIGDYAFAGTKISTLTIPETVETIGNHAFDGCKSLTSIAIPTSVKTIGNYAFNSCTALTNANLEAGLKTIGDYAFSDCTALTGIDIPGSVKTIGEYAFYGASVLNNISLNDGIESIGNHAFHNCRSLTGIAIPASVKTIGNYAFNSCTALTNANLEAGLMTIGNYAFNDCTALTGIDIPGSVKTIGEYAFYGASVLNNISLNDGIESIGKYAFYNCTSLTGIATPASVKTIGDYAFYNTPLNEITLNEGLETIGEKCFSASGYRIVKPVYIPSTLTSVGEDAFSNLKCEYVNISDLAAWCNIDFANENSNPLSQCGSLRLNNEEVKELIIPEGVTAVKQYAFYNCESAKTLIIPNSLTQLANNAFMNCKNITNLTIGTSLEECSGDNFAGCRFEKLTISDGFGNLKLTGSWDNLSIHELYMGRPFEVVK